ncbi:hypothetical protein B5F90_00705 [Alistipes sp. An31A]|nr:hypothetical protein B5F90_00705 [Alistipes sp. An31A]
MPKRLICLYYSLKYIIHNSKGYSIQGIIVGFKWENSIFLDFDRYCEIVIGCNFFFLTKQLESFLYW